MKTQPPEQTGAEPAASRNFATIISQGRKPLVPMDNKSRRSKRLAYTLLELMAALAIIGVVATVGCPRATTGVAESKVAACATHRGNIELQTELWRHDTGAWPATNLSNIGSNLSYFPAGLPLCPVDGSSYSIDASGRVIGHNH